MNFENGMVLLTITATLTSLATEATKKTFQIDSEKISLNALTAIISVISAILVSFAYIILMEIKLTPQIIVYIVSLIIMSWIVANVGYDKVIQLIEQLKFKK